MSKKNTFKCANKEAKCKLFEIMIQIRLRNSTDMLINNWFSEFLASVIWYTHNVQDPIWMLLWHGGATLLWRRKKRCSCPERRMITVLASGLSLGCLLSPTSKPSVGINDMSSLHFPGDQALMFDNNSLKIIRGTSMPSLEKISRVLIQT